MSEWIDIGAVEDVPVLGSRVVQAPGGDIAVFKAADGTLFALRDRCPHKGGPLVAGHRARPLRDLPAAQLGDQPGDGEAQGADHGCTNKIPLRIEGARILLAASALMARAA